MEALWNLEDKWKLTTKEAFLLLVCASIAVIGLCTATVLKKKGQRRQVADRNRGVNVLIGAKEFEQPSCNWVSIKKMLMSSLRWSGANKLEGGSSGDWREKTPPLLGRLDRCEGDIGWQSHNSVSPVWQRPILMGEKCELPRFSGLILYDERGKLLNQSLKESFHNDDILQEKTAAVVRTTLKDLL